MINQILSSLLKDCALSVVKNFSFFSGTKCESFFELVVDICLNAVVEIFCCSVSVMKGICHDI